MEIIVLSGGLCNQMFEYAFFLSKKVNNKNIILSNYSIRRENTHNGYELDRVFNLDFKFNSVYTFLIRFVRKLLLLSKKKNLGKLCEFFIFLIKLFGVNILHEKNVGVYDPSFLTYRKGLSLYFGFWQTEKYFSFNKKEILEKYKFNDLLLFDRNKTLIDKIRNHNSVSIHIRRGDFLSEENKILYSNICTIDYYKKAIDFLQNKEKDLYFYIFSDDMDWVKNNISISNALYIDWNKSENSWQDMYLMSQCKHNIIANSTFSWWGAWLNQNPNKLIIAPKKFLNTIETPDLIPSDWIKL